MTGERSSRMARWNSAVMGLLDGPMHRLYGEQKRTLLQDLPSPILEIGPGPGANLRYYPSGAKLIAVEPNTRSRRRLAAEATRRGLDLEFAGLEGETIELPDGAAASVVMTLVLCSVRDPAQVLAEVRRVLAPGGQLVFLEHVAAARGSCTARAQALLERPWRVLADGCELRRDTQRLLEEAGFAELEVESFTLGAWALPVAPQIIGTAIRSPQ